MLNYTASLPPPPPLILPSMALMCNIFSPSLSRRCFQGCTTASPAPHRGPASSPPRATSSSAPAGSTPSASPAATRRCATGRATRSGRRRPNLPPPPPPPCRWPHFPSAPFCGRGSGDGTPSAEAVTSLYPFFELWNSFESSSRGFRRLSTRPRGGRRHSGHIAPVSVFPLDSTVVVVVVVLRLFIICSHRRAKSSLSAPHFSPFVSQTPAGRGDCFCFQTEKDEKKKKGGGGVGWQAAAMPIEDSGRI